MKRVAPWLPRAALDGVLDAGRRLSPGGPGLIALLLVLVGFVPAAGAQKGFAPLGMDTGKASATLFSRVDGDQVKVAIEIDIEDGWHLYHDDLGNPKAIGLPTIVTLTGDGIAWSAVAFPEPEPLDQSELEEGAWINSHHGTIALYARGELADGATGADVGADLEGLTCEDDGRCIPYRETVASAGAGPDALFAAFPADFGVPDGTPEAGSTDGAAPGGDAGAGTGTSAPEDGFANVDWDAVVFPEFEPQVEQATHGLGMWLLLAFVAGMILNVMPCVLPVISIKVLSFVQQAGEDKQRILALGLAFASGIVVVFLALATLAVTAKLSWGEQFQSQEFLVVMIGIVFALALSLFGLFEIGVPTTVGALAGKQMREGLGDAFFKGMLATVLATPCSGPFLGSTLTWTLAQPDVTVFAVFLTLGLGMALPYVVLTANPGLLRIVPKPGPWMDTFKTSMGFVLLATVVYLMISLQQDLLLFTLAFLVFVALGCWWYGHYAAWDKSRAKRWVALVVALLIVAGGAHFSFRTFRGLFESADVHWEEFEPVAFESYLEEGRSIFVDFTADWCPNCKYNEKWVYDSDEVEALLQSKGVVKMKADITHGSARTSAIERLMLGLGARSIPFMAVFPGDDPLRPQVRFDIVGKDDMLEILEALPRT